MNRPLFPTTLSIPSYDTGKYSGLRNYQHPLLYKNDYTTNFVIWNSSTLFHNVARHVRPSAVHKNCRPDPETNNMSAEPRKNCWHCKLCTKISVNSKRLFRHQFATKPYNKSHCLIIHGFRKWIIQYVSYMLQPLIVILLPIPVRNNHCVLKNDLMITQTLLIEYYAGNLIIYMMTYDSNNMEKKENTGTEIKRQ